MVAAVKTKVKADRIELIDKDDLKVTPTLALVSSYKEEDPNGSSQTKTWENQLRKLGLRGVRFELVGYGSGKFAQPGKMWATFNVMGV